MEKRSTGWEGDPVKVRARARWIIPEFVYFSLLALTSAILSGCDALGPEDRFFAEPRTFSHELFDTEAECNKARESHPEANCTEIVFFCPDGSAAWLIGGDDIIWGGTYAIRRSRVVLQATQTGTSFSFLLSEGGDALVRETSGAVWERSFDGTGGFSSAGCSLQ